MPTPAKVRLYRTPTGYATRDGRFELTLTGHAIPHKHSPRYSLTDHKTGAALSMKPLAECRLWIAGVLMMETTTNAPAKAPEAREWHCYRPRR